MNNLEPLPTDPRMKPMEEEKSKSPNKSIDKALRDLMKQSKTLSPDTMVKVIAAAISWEKVKNAIKDKDEEFDPDQL